MEVKEQHLLNLIDKAIDDAKARGGSGNKFHQGMCKGYAKALEQVRFAMTEEGGTSHLSVGVMR